MSRAATGRTAALVVIALLVGACGKGGGTGESPSSAASATSPASGAVGAYVKTVCTSMSGWMSKIQQRATDFSSKEAGVSDLDTARKDLVGYLNEVADDTDEMVSAVRAAGAPPVADGSTTQASLVAGLQAVSKLFRDSAAKAADLDTSNPQAFQKSATKVATSITGGATGLKDAFDKIALDPSLDAAFNADPSCSSLKG